MPDISSSINMVYSGSFLKEITSKNKNHWTIFMDLFIDEETMLPKSGLAQDL